MQSLGLDLRTTMLRRAVDLGAQFAPDRASHVEGAAILAASAPGSVGDEAMLTALSQALASRGLHRQALLAMAPHDAGEGMPAAAKRVDLSGYMLQSSLRPLIHLTPVLHGMSDFYAIGADMLDGHYSVMGSVKRIVLAGFAARLGCRVTIAGFSFNDAPAPQVVRALQDLPASVRLCARDPVSAARLEATLPGRVVNRTADLAFLLEPETQASSFQELAGWAEAERAQGSLVIGLNVAALNDGNGDALVAAHLDAVRMLAGQVGRIAVLLIPHDFKTTAWTASDVEVAARLHQALAPLLGERVRIVEAPFRAGHVKALCGHLDVLLAGRMHCAIAGLARGVPTACIAYQGKFEGLFDHFGLPRELLLERDDATQAGAVAALALRLVEGREALRSCVQAALPSVLLRARENLVAT